MNYDCRTFISNWGEWKVKFVRFYKKCYIIFSIRTSYTGNVNDKMLNKIQIHSIHQGAGLLTHAGCPFLWRTASMHVFKNAEGESWAEDSTWSVAYSRTQQSPEAQWRIYTCWHQVSLEVETHWVAETGREQQVRAEGEDKRGGIHVGKQQTGWEIYSEWWGELLWAFITRPHCALHWTFVLIRGCSPGSNTGYENI